jgi:dTMP kinase
VEEKKDAITISLLFMADRREHSKDICAWLEEGKIVLCDRYADSTFAYQSAHLAAIMENPLKWLKQAHAPFYLTPDTTFLFLLDSKTALSRMKNREKTFFETLSFLQKVQEMYLLFSKEHRFTTLDATERKETLKKICIEKIEKEMGY